MYQVPIDTAALQELKNIMGEDFSLLIEVFINDSDRRIINLKEAIAEKNAPELRNIAHGFKGSALNLSALQLTEICSKLEAMGRDNQLSDAAELLEQLIAEYEVVKRYLLD